MITYIEKRRTTFTYRVLCAFVAFTFAFSVILPPQAAAQLAPQTILNLPLPGTLVTVTPGFTPPMILGITFYPDNPLMFDFIVDSGDVTLNRQELEDEATKLIKYFLASLTVPEEDMWVNLSPYEKDRIIPEGFDQTEMGRDMLAQDYLLKQLTASLMYPEDELGKKFWDRVYTKAYEKFGTTEIPMNTFNKVWIIPESASIYENEDSVFVVDSHLKVMLEEDYVALQKNAGVEKYGLDSIAEGDAQVISGVNSEVVREVLIPEIEKEVNKGKTFANLRQIFNSTILAVWYKQNLKESLLGQVYVDQNKIRGVDVEDKQIKQKIYDQYVEAFKKGVYDYIKEDYDPVTQEIIPRKYFSGGIIVAGKSNSGVGPGVGVTGFDGFGPGGGIKILELELENVPMEFFKRANSGVVRTTVTLVEVPEGKSPENIFAAIEDSKASSQVQVTLGSGYTLTDQEISYIKEGKVTFDNLKELSDTIIGILESPELLQLDGLVFHDIKNRLEGYLLQIYEVTWRIEAQSTIFSSVLSTVKKIAEEHASEENFIKLKKSIDDLLVDLKNKQKTPNDVKNYRERLKEFLKQLPDFFDNLSNKEFFGRFAKLSTLIDNLATAETDQEMENLADRMDEVVKTPEIQASSQVVILQKDVNNAITKMVKEKIFIASDVEATSLPFQGALSEIVNAKSKFEDRRQVVIDGTNVDAIISLLDVFITDKDHEKVQVKRAEAIKKILITEESRREKFASHSRASSGVDQKSLKKRILVVDDDDVSAIKYRFVNFYEFEVVEAKNGKEALELVQNQHFDAMITDTNMPNMEGTELIQEISKLGDKAKLLKNSVIWSAAPIGDLAIRNEFRVLGVRVAERGVEIDDVLLKKSENPDLTPSESVITDENNFYEAMDELNVKEWEVEPQVTAVVEAEKIEELEAAGAELLAVVKKETFGNAESLEKAEKLIEVKREELETKASSLQTDGKIKANSETDQKSSKLDSKKQLDDFKKLMEFNFRTSVEPTRNLETRRLNVQGGSNIRDALITDDPQRAIQDILNLKQIGNFKIVNSEKSVSELYQLYLEQGGSSVAIYPYLKEMLGDKDEVEDKLVVIRADISNLNEQGASKFLLEIVENSPGQEWIDFANKRSVEVLFVFTDIDYFAYAAGASKALIRMIRLDDREIYYNQLGEDLRRTKEHQDQRRAILEQFKIDQHEERPGIFTRASSAFIKGGINLNPALLNLQIKRDGNGVPLPVNMQPIHEMKIDGFVPVIINVTPVLNLPLLLGLADTEMPINSADADSQTIPLELSIVDRYRNKYIREYEYEDVEV